MASYNGYPDDYRSAMEWTIVRDSIAPLAETCNECGAEIEREPHDAACITGWLADMGVGYTDDTTDLPDRYNESER